MSAWAGRKVRRLVNLTLAIKGTTCHLCHDPEDPTLSAGADSADHDPTRDDLVRAGVPDPDALAYLWPAHRACNLRRNDRPITDALRLELRVKRRRDLDRSTADLSPRFRGLVP